MRGRAHDTSLPKEALSSVQNSGRAKYCGLLLWADWFCCFQRVFLDQWTLKDGRDLDGWRDMAAMFRGTGSRVRETFVQILALLLPSMTHYDLEQVT